jgi:[protein-PII] uridylyltransferase
MATRSFVVEKHPEGLAVLLKDASFPKNVQTARQNFAAWIEKELIEKLDSFGNLREVKPILLGSWSRHELTPKSDIDLLFAGPEDKVKVFVGEAFQAGLKLRSRTPEDPNDWSKGVQPFDLLALHRAQALYEEDQNLVEAQRAHAVKARKEILKAVRLEREERHKRQDSISNYLEPNLKYGSGGLRDIEQALALRELFPGAFLPLEDYPFRVLRQIKEELLFLRALLHLMNSGDVLSANDQLEISKILKLESPQVLMKLVQSELERASFYADWVVSTCAAGPKKRQAARKGLGSLSEAILSLRHDSGVLHQYELRRSINELSEALNDFERGKILHKAIASDQPDNFLVALHRTRAFEVLIPDVKKLKGLVQHDHYHRFTADAHLVQTLREVQRLKTTKRVFGIIGRLNEDLSAQDWWILKLTALFHDLAKGRKGDHATEGAKLVEKYFEAWRYPDNLKTEVAWLVQNHLLLSNAAFRQNPQAQSTWKRLFERGVVGHRLILLALFTAIDIRATNPEAWTPWKSQLLLNLVRNLQSPEAKSLQSHLDFAKKAKITDADQWLARIDPAILQMLPPKVLLTDLHAAARAKDDLPVLVLKSKQRVWVRFHRKRDRSGLFLSFVSQLFGLGLSIQLSSVNTLESVGVYDWFCLRTEKPVKQIATWLAKASFTPPNVPPVTLQSVSLMAADDDEWILSFKGKDQRGLLLAAAQALFDEHLSLRWARAHTWGSQVEDIFGVQPLGEVDRLLKRLQDRFVT